MPLYPNYACVVAVALVELRQAAIEISALHYRVVSRKGTQEVAQIALLGVALPWADLGLCTCSSGQSRSDTAEC